MIAHNEGEGYGDYSESSQREFCKEGWDVAAGPRSSCKVPTTAQRNEATFGNLFVTADTEQGTAVVAYQRYMASRVASAIAALARGIKQETGGRAWVSAYYGYLFHSPGALSWDGHAAVSQLLAEPALDGIPADLETLLARFPSGRSPSRDDGSDLSS